MPPKPKSSERLQQEAEALRARAAALQYLAKTGSGPSQKEIAQQQKEREKWTNATTQAVQQRLAKHLQPAISATQGLAPTRDNTLAAMAAHRARVMLQTGGSGEGVRGGERGGGSGEYEPLTGYPGGAAWMNGVAVGGVAGEGDELPEGWKPAVDPGSGETYYWNEKTKETSWDRPKRQPSQASEHAQSKDEGEEELEEGWEEVEDPHSGQSYFWHRESNETTWTKPIKKTVSLEQAREAKSKLDAILNKCGPKKKSSLAQPKTSAEAAVSSSIAQQKSTDGEDNLVSRKRGAVDAEEPALPLKKTRPGN